MLMERKVQELRQEGMREKNNQQTEERDAEKDKTGREIHVLQHTYLYIRVFRHVGPVTAG